MKDFLAISVAAIVGANLRYLLSRLAVREFGPVFPYGTLIINILGSFIVGLCVIWTTERVLVDPRWRLLVVVGFVQIDCDLHCHGIRHSTAPALLPCRRARLRGTIDCC